MQLIKNKLNGVFSCPGKFLELPYFKIQQNFFLTHSNRYNAVFKFTTDSGLLPSCQPGPIIMIQHNHAVLAESVRPKLSLEEI